MEPRRVDGKAKAIADPRSRSGIDARAKEGLVLDEQGRVLGLLSGLCGDFRGLDREKDVSIRPQLLDDDGRDFDLRRSGPGRGGVLEAFRPDAEDDPTAARRRRSARGVKRNSILTEHRLVAVDLGLDQVHRRGPYERGHEQIAWLVVQLLRSVDLEKAPVAHD